MNYEVIPNWNGAENQFKKQLTRPLTTNSGPQAADSARRRPEGHGLPSSVRLR